MNNIKKGKSKEEKLRELQFLFEGERKPEKEFRNDPIYKAIFEAINRRNYESFLSFDVDKDIRIHHPEIIKELKGKSVEDTVVGRTLGAKLKQLKFWGMLVILEGEPEIRRQKTFAVDEDVKDKLKEYVGGNY